MIDSNVVIDSDAISIAMKSIVLMPYPKETLNVTITQEGDSTSSISSEFTNESIVYENLNDIYSFITIPTDYLNLIQQSDESKVPSGTYSSKAYVSVQWEVEPEREYDDNQLYWPNKVVKYANNSIYCQDTIDDYRLDGIWNSRDDVCYYDYIDPFDPPTFLPYNEYFCFKPFTYEGRYYDIIYIFCEAVVFYNSS